MHHSIRFLSCVALLLAGTAATAQDAAAGKVAFARCSACHSVEGGNGIGPSLRGVLGRKVGSLTGFRYSPGMQAATTTWDAASLNAFIALPQQTIPGNAMPFAGIADAKVRDDIVAYLSTLK